MRLTKSLMIRYFGKFEYFLAVTRRVCSEICSLKLFICDIIVRERVSKLTVPPIRPATIRTTPDPKFRNPNERVVILSDKNLKILAIERFQYFSFRMFKYLTDEYNP